MLIVPVDMIRKIIFILIVISFSACYRISYKFTLDQSKTYRSEHWNNYFIYGFAPVNERYSFDELCPNGVPSRLDTKISGANFLASIFSLGLTGANSLSAQCIPSTQSITTSQAKPAANSKPATNSKAISTKTEKSK